MTPSSILFYIKVLGVIAIVTVVGTITKNVMSMSSVITEQAATIKRLEGRLSGAYMRIDRRDNAIAALPDKCRAMAQEWVKTGDIPAAFNPFGANHDQR